ncbi:hypothetical protein EC988_000838 [Linderina pennispora]|nr:hypothetical protein EC988_000838 [Linderina pennispora]
MVTNSEVATAVTTSGIISLSTPASESTSITTPVSVPMNESNSIRYFRDLVTTRDTLNDSLTSGLVKAYGDVVRKELLRPLANPSVHDMIDLSTQSIDRHGDLFKDIKGDIYHALLPLDAAIWKYLHIALDKSDIVELLARQPDIFSGIMRSEGSRFNCYAFSLSPAKYLSRFIPSGVKTLDNERLSWRTFLIETSPPLLKHFVKHDLVDARDWCAAKRAVGNTLQSVGGGADNPITVADDFPDCWAAVRYLADHARLPATAVPWLVANCTAAQQQELVERLGRLGVRKIAGYDFSHASPGNGEAIKVLLQNDMQSMKPLSAGFR